jgi:hypothetical protein
MRCARKAGIEGSCGAERGTNANTGTAKCDPKKPRVFLPYQTLCRSQRWGLLSRQLNPSCQCNQRMGVAEVCRWCLCFFVGNRCDALSLFRAAVGFSSPTAVLRLVALSLPLFCCCPFPRFLFSALRIQFNSESAKLREEGADQCGESANAVQPIQAEFACCH